MCCYVLNIANQLDIERGFIDLLFVEHINLSDNR